MNIKITRLDSRLFLDVAGDNLLEISNYKISSPVNIGGNTELELKIVLKNEDKFLIDELTN